MKPEQTAAEMPLARVLAMAFRSIIDELHLRLEERGWGELRPAHGFVLVNVRDRVTTAQDVARLMGMSKQAAAKLVDSMEAMGLVMRSEHPEDRRAFQIAITSRGQEALAVVESIYREIEAEWSQAIGRERVEKMRNDLVEALTTIHGGELPALRPVWG